MATFFCNRAQLPNSPMQDVFPCFSRRVSVKSSYDRLPTGLFGATTATKVSQMLDIPPRDFCTDRIQLSFKSQTRVPFVCVVSCLCWRVHTYMLTNVGYVITANCNRWSILSNSINGFIDVITLSTCRKINTHASGNGFSLSAQKVDDRSISELLQIVDSVSWQIDYHLCHRWYSNTSPSASIQRIRPPEQSIYLFLAEFNLKFQPIEWQSNISRAMGIY